MDGKQLAVYVLLTMVVPAGAEREIAGGNGSVHRAFTILVDVGGIGRGGLRARDVVG